MEHLTSTRHRVFIIAKTYPELSSKYGETVCTAAISETGEALRLYPIPFRYLAGPQKFKRYQWLSVSLEKNARDNRPESYTLSSSTIELNEEVPGTSDEWGKRGEIVLKSSSWQYKSMTSLFSDQASHGRSLAFIRPVAIKGVTLKKRAAEDAETFEQKLSVLRAKNKAARSQLALFESTMPPPMKNLQYIGERVCVDWTCADEDCNGHSMQILDWEICELARKEGLEAAKQKVSTLLNPETHRTAFILGNFHMFPASFAIIGLWYPQRSDRLF